MTEPHLPAADTDPSPAPATADDAAEPPHLVDTATVAAVGQAAKERAALARGLLFTEDGPAPERIGGYERLREALRNSVGGPLQDLVEELLDTEGAATPAAEAALFSDVAATAGAVMHAAKGDLRFEVPYATGDVPTGPATPATGQYL